MSQPLRTVPKSSIAIDNRHDPQTRRKLSAPAIRTFLNVASAWRLTGDEQRALLGWPAESTFYKYKAGQVGTLPYDTLIRISLVLGVYKALHILYPEPALADGWIKLPNTNPIFDGLTPLATIMEVGMDGLHQVRRLLDGRRGAW